MDRRPRHDGVGDIVAMQVYEHPFDMVDFEGATHALRDLAGPHHEVLDEELAASVEQVGERDLAFRRVEDVLFLNLHPRQLAALPAQLISQPGKFFLLGEQLLAGCDPFVV
jgi:hypothetical protein